MPQDEYRWPCEQCGAQLRFAPGQTRLVCDHCGHVQDIPAEAPSVETGVNMPSSSTRKARKASLPLDSDSK